jgi:hypothetical protein
MWFDLPRHDLGFIKTSPHKFENEAVIDASPDRVFSCLTGEGQADWFKDFVGMQWLSPEPHGVGASRVVTLKTLRVTERVLAFEPGKRFAFTVDRITLPLVRGMLEDMQIEPISEKKTRVIWTAHYEPSMAMRLVHPIARSIFGGMFRDSMTGLTRYAEKNASV